MRGYSIKIDLRPDETILDIISQIVHFLCKINLSGEIDILTSQNSGTSLEI
jgi:hypothetical protein